MKSGYQPSPICSICRGKCCKQMGCEYSPDDFKDLSYEGLLKEIEQGHISIDWWEGDVLPQNKLWRVFYLRARNMREPIVSASWGGICSLLTDNGCALPFDKRPKSGRHLKPGEDEDHCKSDYGKRDSCIDWREHQDVLTRLWRHFDYGDDED